MEFIQKKSSTQHTFTFHDEYFNFAYKDKNGSGDVDLNYADLPKKTSIQIDQNEWLRNVAYLWLAIGLFDLLFLMFAGKFLFGLASFLLIGAVCLVWFHKTKVTYTIFRAEKANVFVMQDNNHDRLIKELNNRRKGQLLKWYGEVNPENDIETEIRKFRWLEDQGILTKEEAESKIAQSELIHRKKEELPGEFLN